VSNPFMRRLRVTQTTVKNGKVMLTMTRSRYLVVTINGTANFFVPNASDEALADALLMIMTYDPEKACGV
jgi:hypothetical protein